ncbi:MAG: quinone-dependent dihydroorotate dehydrogenase [Solitalea-like symbiont of Tyrophagus putrescentiae]
MYKFIKFILFTFDAEKAHKIVINSLKIFKYIPGVFFIIRNIYCRSKRNPVVIDNLIFKNKVGLAAGFDKNAEVFNELSTFGFSFIEVGAITPKPQQGNTKPRIFRLKKDEAIINRMGFNNIGLEEAKKNLKKSRRKDLIIGCNIGKNKTTPNEQAIKDYLQCFKDLFQLVHYFSINVSSPNTPGLRDLQQSDFLDCLLNKLQEENYNYPVQKPIFLKISPDLDFEEVDAIIEVAIKNNITGLVVSNTTTTRPDTLQETKLAVEQGGLSGKPICTLNTQLIKYIASKSSQKLKIIASGGIFSVEDAKDKLMNGADLIQIYTGFIYKGPALIKELAKL